MGGRRPPTMPHGWGKNYQQTRSAFLTRSTLMVPATVVGCRKPDAVRPYLLQNGQSGDVYYLVDVVAEGPGVLRILRILRVVPACYTLASVFNYFFRRSVLGNQVAQLLQKYQVVRGETTHGSDCSCVLRWMRWLVCWRALSIRWLPERSRGRHNQNT